MSEGKVHFRDLIIEYGMLFAAVKLALMAFIVSIVKSKKETPFLPWLGYLILWIIGWCFISWYIQGFWMKVPH